MSDCKEFAAFCEKIGNDAAVEFLEELCDMEWNHEKKSKRISIYDTYRHDMTNYTHSGTFTYEGVEYGFVIDNGNWNGTVVREWGLADDVGIYDPPKPTFYTFVPVNGTLREDSPGMFTVYLDWRKKAWFQDKERGYNYDRHFAPGSKTESYYRDWAATKGMKIVTQEEADTIINRPKRDLIPMEELMATWENTTRG